MALDIPNVPLNLRGATGGQPFLDAAETLNRRRFGAEACADRYLHEHTKIAMSPREAVDAALPDDVIDLEELNRYLFGNGFRDFQVRLAPQGLPQLMRKSPYQSPWESGSARSERSTATALVRHGRWSASLFRIRLARHYGNVLEDADLQAARDPFLVDPDSEVLDDKVKELLGAGGLLAGFGIAGARRAVGGIQLRFQRSDAPEPTVLVAAPDRPEPRYRVAGRLRLSYMQLLDEPYPEALVREIFDVLAARIMDKERDWLTLVSRAAG
jgi:hypothetical protein